MMAPPSSPRCLDCGAGLGQENWNPSQRDQRRLVCKSCHGARSRAWARSNREASRAIGRRWYDNHREEIARRRRERKQTLRQERALP